MNLLKDTLQKVAPLTDEDANAFLQLGRPVKFKKGDIFVREGESCHQLLFIERGLLRYYVLHEGEDYTKDFAVDTENPFCTAFTSFMTRQPSEIWIEALEDCNGLIWEQEDVLPLFEQHPAWIRFVKTLTERLYYRKEQKELQLIKCSAAERYQLFLKQFPGISQRVPQYHIASYLGITPESLSRIRGKTAS